MKDGGQDHGHSQEENLWDFVTADTYGMSLDEIADYALEEFYRQSCHRAFLESCWRDLQLSLGKEDPGLPNRHLLISSEDPKWQSPCRDAGRHTGGA